MKNTPFTISDSAYEIESQLGSGGGGVVYKAWHKRLEKYVVIKELKYGSQNDIETQRNEVEALKNVKSEFLPQVLDFIVQENRVFTVMEFINGDSFDKLLKSGQKFSQQQVIKWYGQLASALKKIHDRNIAHRDIKPANIMLMPDGNVCLIDFNVAFVSGNDLKLVSRSLGYASPEQYNAYEKQKDKLYAASSITNGSAAAAASDNDETAALDSTKTLITNTDSDPTALLDENEAQSPADQTYEEEKEFIDWKLSDIYSLGATMYHLLTGVRPAERAENVTPLSGMGNFSEGITYVIERSMNVSPKERFQSASELYNAVTGIHSHDARWRMAQIRKLAAVIILPFAFLLFAGTAFFGYRLMLQEKEESFYSAVYEILNGDAPQDSYNYALSIDEHRIEPYEAMAERLWNDGNTEQCLSFIEENLGNIAEFKTIAEAQDKYANLYYILGNCYYYRFDENGYSNAADCFATAVEYVKTKPEYYRDYAVALAKKGNIEQAKKELEKAQVLDLNVDSLNIINGEIYYSAFEYDKALECFEKVIQTTADDYMRYRAYMSADDIYSSLGETEKSLSLLVGAVDRVPFTMQGQIKQRLAYAYTKNGDYEKAVSIYKELIDNDIPQFNVMMNLAILYENIKQYDEAAAELKEMKTLFPDDYRIPMRQAYLEADRQSAVSNSQDRDYSMIETYYNEAYKLYEHALQHDSADAEMEQLGLLIQQLKANNWLN